MLLMMHDGGVEVCERCCVDGGEVRRWEMKLETRIPKLGLLRLEDLHIKRLFKLPSLGEGDTSGCSITAQPGDGRMAKPSDSFLMFCLLALYAVFAKGLGSISRFWLHFVFD
jgi:hypothetical protein